MKDVTPLSRSAQRVQQALAAKGMRCEVVELPDSTRSAREAAAAVGCEVGQIAKSLIFRTVPHRRPLLIIASGRNRVHESVVAEALGESLEIAPPDFVREQTGFAIGGVPPIGHRKPLETLIDEDLLTYDRIWAAAGTPHAVFPLTPQELIAITGGRVLAIC